MFMNATQKVDQGQNCCICQTNVTSHVAQPLLLLLTGPWGGGKRGFSLGSSRTTECIGT